MTIAKGKFNRLNPANSNQYFIRMEDGAEYLFTGTYIQARLHEYWEHDDWEHDEEQDNVCTPATAEDFWNDVDIPKQQPPQPPETIAIIRAFKDKLIAALKDEDFGDMNLTDEHFEFIDEYEEVRFFIFSPDRIPFHKEGFKTLEEANRGFWRIVKERFERQGYYSTCRRGFREELPLADLPSECYIQEFVGGEGWNEVCYDIDLSLAL